MKKAYIISILILAMGLPLAAENQEILPRAAATQPIKLDLQPSQLINKYLGSPVQGSGGVEKALFNSSVYAMVALNVADYLTTRKALAMPGLEEGNPMMKPFVKNQALFIAVKGGITALSYFSMKSLYKKDKKVAWVLTTVSNFLLSYVVVNNMRLINQSR